MTKKDIKLEAQNLIMHQIAIVGYGRFFDEFYEKYGEEGEAILKQQMDRVARIFGFKEAWFD